jgi:hypothetical protein
MLITIPHPVTVEGCVSPGFGPVRDAFAENFVRRHEPFASCWPITRDYSRSTNRSVVTPLPTLTVWPR